LIISLVFLSLTNYFFTRAGSLDPGIIPKYVNTTFHLKNSNLSER
jgi:hypothetical protein